MTLHEELRERHMGVLQGVSRRDADALMPDLANFSKGSDDDYAVPGGGEVQRPLGQGSRLDGTRGCEVYPHGARVAVVTHGARCTCSKTGATLTILEGGRASPPRWCTTAASG